MAIVTDTFDLRAQFYFNIWKSFAAKFSKNGLNFIKYASVGLLAGSCVIGALGIIEVVVPAFVPIVPIWRRLPNSLPQQLAIIDHKVVAEHVIRQHFMNASSTAISYSNTDWQINTRDEKSDIIADIGNEGIIEERAIDLAAVTEPRAERVAFTPKVTEIPQTTVVPKVLPDINAPKAAVEDVPGLFLPDDIPLPSPKPSVVQQRNEQAPKLAYAPTTAKAEALQSRGLLHRLFGSRIGGRSAIYDISAATVYLPSGEKLEAHSGIGAMRDNPRSVTQKNRGATPPHTYNLRMRESLFHGVAAIRLTPVDGRNPHNRDGLLAHTYMLGRSGDSNGCVVFKEYARFLNAFKRGEFDQLVVVEHMNAKPSRVASVF